MKKKMVSIYLCIAISILSFPTHSVIATADTFKYLDECEIIKTDQYVGNQGDSFIYTIGQGKYTRGNTDINGTQYEHGLEAWIARWNFIAEESWAYAVYDIGGNYKTLSGDIVLIKSYNTTNFDSSLCFYDYDKNELLKEYRLVPEDIPFSVDVDVSNVRNLSVYVKDNKAVSGGTSFGLVNFRLMTNHQLKVLLDGTELSFDQPPIKENDRVMVPIRTIFEALGYTVDWYDDTQTAVAQKGSNTITVRINNPEISYSGGTYLCDVSPKIVSDRTLVPVRAISECAGCIVNWDEATNTVLLTSNETPNDVIYTTKIVSIDADSLDEWKEKVEYEERGLRGISTTAYHSDGSYQYHGTIITDREVLAYKEIEVDVPAVQGIGLASEYKTVKLQIPSQIKYTLHKHKVENKMDATFWGSLMAGLVEQNLVWTQSCECGYKNQLTWEIPIDDFQQYSGEDLYVKTETTLP